MSIRDGTERNCFGIFGGGEFEDGTGRNRDSKKRETVPGSWLDGTGQDGTE